MIGFEKLVKDGQMNWHQTIGQTYWTAIAIYRVKYALGLYTSKTLDVLSRKVLSRTITSIDISSEVFQNIKFT